MLSKTFEYSKEMIKEIKVPVIGWFCTYIPEEIILAAGAHPYRVKGGYTPTGRSERYLPNFFCPYVVSCLDMALKGHYDSLDGVVFANSCNAMERLHDIWKQYLKPSFSYMLDVPRKSAEENIIFFRQRIKGFKESIENDLNVSITDKDIRDAVSKTNKTRALLKRLASIAAEGDERLGIYRLLQIINASSYLQRDEYNQKLEESLEILSKQVDPQKIKKPKIMLVGSILEDLELLNIIESSNARVIADELCIGSRYYSIEVKEGSDPFESLSRAYLQRIPCPRMVGSGKSRIEYIMKRIEELGIDAVIYHSLKFCINHSYDYLAIKKALNEEGIPVMLVESNYDRSGIEQLRVRIQAFIEML